ncbi:MAG: Coq4 family protein [Polyangiales bacterium]
MNATAALPLPVFDLRRAGRAISALLRDPDDLPQVFTILESLSGTAPHRLLRAFRRTASGARLLRERPDLVALLSDREALRKLPEGSLGRAYLAFVESEGISPAGIRDARERGLSESERVADFEFVHGRMTDTHDLWHTVTGYQGDVVGEAALLAFYLAQNWNAGIALIVSSAWVKGRVSGIGPVIAEGYRRGRTAAWLPAQEWESMLALPLAEVRARLGLGDPPVYTPVRAAEYRANATK